MIQKLFDYECWCCIAFPLESTLQLRYWQLMYLLSCNQ